MLGEREEITMQITSTKGNIRSFLQWLKCNVINTNFDFWISFLLYVICNVILRWWTYIGFKLTYLHLNFTYSVKHLLYDLKGTTVNHTYDVRPLMSMYVLMKDSSPLSDSVEFGSVTWVVTSYRRLAERWVLGPCHQYFPSCLGGPRHPDGHPISKRKGHHRSKFEVLSTWEIVTLMKI